MEHYNNTEEQTVRSLMSSPSFISRDDVPRKSILRNGSMSPPRKRMLGKIIPRVSFNIIDEIFKSELKRKPTKFNEFVERKKSASPPQKKNTYDFGNHQGSSILNVIKKQIIAEENYKKKGIKKTVANNEIVSSIFRDKFRENPEETQDQSSQKKRGKSVTFKKDSTFGTSSTVNTNNTQFQINIYKINQNSADFNLNHDSSESIISLDESMSKSNENQLEDFKQLTEDPNFYKSIYDRQVGSVAGFCSNSFINYKSTNEDKLSIGINLKPRQMRTNVSAMVNFFSIFDGHRGDSVSEDLRSNFRETLMEDLEFLSDTEDALTRTFQKMEEKIILRNNLKTRENLVDKGGSCALVLVMISK
jgi:hypothetical protein